MTVEYMHICDYAFPAEGGKPCIIGVFDRVWGQSFPFRHAVMCIAIQLRGQAHETAAIRVEFGRPNGDVLAAIDANVVGGAEGGAFINLNMVNIEFPDAGRYTIRVRSGGQVLASQSIRAELRQQPPQAGQIRH
jgi:hypothetical protein